MNLKPRQLPILFLPILGLYLLLSLYQLDLPGIHYDEAFEVVPAIQLLQGQPVFSFRNSGFTVADRLYPIMTQDYIGAINTYVSIPFVYFFGPTPQSLRIPAIFIGAITLCLAYLLTSYLTKNPLIGLGTALLLAVDPTFVFWNRQGIFVTAVTATLGLGALYCGLRRWNGGRMGWGLAAAFLFGFGLYAKLLFLWFITALVATLALLHWRHLSPTGLKAYLAQLNLTRLELILFLLAFLGGCGPLLLYNIQTQGTILNITENAQTSYYGVDNAAFRANLLERIHQFGVLLNGSHLWYLGEIYSNLLPVIIFVVLGLLMLYTLTTRNLLSGYKISLFPFLIIGFVLLASVRTVSALWVTHFAVLMPWPAMALMMGLWGPVPYPL